MNERTKRTALAAAMRQLAERIEGPEAIDPGHVIDQIEEWLIELRLLIPHELDPTDHINGVELDSVIDAVHALTEAGVVGFDVHARFWAQWTAAMQRHDVPRAMHGPSFAPRVKVDDRDNIRSVVGPFIACSRPDCSTCGHLMGQWLEEVEPGAIKPDRSLDSSLN